MIVLRLVYTAAVMVVVISLLRAGYPIGGLLLVPAAAVWLRREAEPAGSPPAFAKRFVRSNGDFTARSLVQSPLLRSMRSEVPSHAPSGGVPRVHPVACVAITRRTPRGVGPWGNIDVPA